jgi:hypothetical protein
MSENNKSGVDTESRVGPTPNGGVRSTIYYRDANGDPISKEKATQVEIIEYDSAGLEVFRTYGKIDR